jgi:23S rRNA pseudouridine1911/1915/1917 synthase
MNRQALHAKTLGFIHPATGKACDFDSELPEDMQKLLAYLDTLSLKSD